MKKGTKIWLVIVVILVLMGGSLCISAFAMGMTQNDLIDMFDSGVFSFGKWEDVSTVHKEMEHTIEHVEKDENYHSKSTEKMLYSYLELDIDRGDVTIQSSDGKEIYIESASGDEKYFNLEVTDSGISLKSKNTSKLFGTQAPKATLHLPEGSSFETVSLDLDAGMVDIQNVTVEWLQIDCDAGKITFEGVTYEGGEIDVDAGSVEVTLNEKTYEDYNYDIDVSAGTLKINDETYTGLDEEKYINHHADGEWEISCDAGKVEMKINK